MSHIGRIAIAIAVATLALPAAAGSWPNLPVRKTPQNVAPTAREMTLAAPAERWIVNGFEYVGGEAGWQLSPHKLLWVKGQIAHSDECDHVIRSVKAPTPGDLESSRKLYPGA